jgi:hypothetical protein
MRIAGFVFLPVLMGSVAVSAQDVREAYNISNIYVQGTARSVGFGNALGSVGGDFSSLSVNPAGLGIYRTSELSFSGALKVNGATGDYAGSSTSDNTTRFGVSNFSTVFTNAPKGKRYDRASWKAVSFAFGMNRIADFNRNYTYSGRNTTSSASQVFESDANKYPGDATSSQPTNAPGYIGYQSYVLDRTATNAYYSIVPFSGGIIQTRHVEERGSNNEYVISLGGNYMEKLMLGMTLGLPYFHYIKTTAYTETLAPGNNNNPGNFNYSSYGQYLDISGGGVNGKFGAIYKFSKLFRAGIAFHTPTYYSIRDDYDPSMVSVVGGTQYILSTSPYYGNAGLVHNSFDYHLSTPWKTVVSATLMLNDIGFITADYEYVNYASAHYSYPDGYDYSSGKTFQDEANEMNQAIKKTYKGVSNFRLGGEIKAVKDFMVRAGFGYYGDPYTTAGKADLTTGYTTERIDLSVGVGFHFRYFFADCGYVHSIYQGYEQPYSIDYSNVVSGPAAAIPSAKINYSLNNIVWTVGVKF